MVYFKAPKSVMTVHGLFGMSENQGVILPSIAMLSEKI